MKKARILIVEDEAIIAMEIENQLQSLGYEVTSVVNTGEKAVEKTEADQPDLILMDIRIKGDKDGIDTAEKIRNKFGIPVIFSTAYLDEERIERAKITMPFGYVLKPIQERDLKVTLEMALYVAKIDAERKKAEDKTIQFGQILEDSLNEIYIFDNHNLIFSQVNRGARENLQYSIEELKKMTPLDIKPEHTTESFNKLVEPLLGGKEKVVRFNTVHERKDKTRYQVTVNLQLVSYESSLFFVAIIKDITDSVRAEKAMRESEEKYRELFKTMVLGIVYQNANGSIIDANPAAERILGLSLDQMQGRTSMDPRWKAIHEDGSDFPGDTHPGMEALKTGKKVNNVVMGVFHPQKEEHRWININAVPKFREGESTPYENYATFEDITELKKGKE